MTKIKRNDSGIVIPYTLPEEYRNLDGASVEFLLENKRSTALVARGEAVIIDPAAGHLAYTLAEGETLSAGIHIGEFQVTYADGTFISFPRSGYLEVDIQRNIDGGRALESEERIAVKVSLIDEKFDAMAAENAAFKGEVGAQVAAIEAETAEWRESVTDDVLADVYEQVDVDRVSNTEVREARGGEATLGAKIAKVDSQLAQTASQNYVDTVLASIGDGSPNEIFYSLSALRGRYPQGSIGVKLVFDTSFGDGAHAFLWNGSSWEDIGLYQGKEVADNSITTEKLVPGTVEPRHSRNSLWYVLEDDTLEVNMSDRKVYVKKTVRAINGRGFNQLSTSIQPEYDFSAIYTRNSTYKLYMDTGDSNKIKMVDINTDTNQNPLLAIIYLDSIVVANENSIYYVDNNNQRKNRIYDVNFANVYPKGVLSVDLANKRIKTSGSMQLFSQTINFGLSGARDEAYVEINMLPGYIRKLVYNRDLRRFEMRRYDQTVSANAQVITFIEGSGKSAKCYDPWENYKHITIDGFTYTQRDEGSSDSEEPEVDYAWDQNKFLLPKTLWLLKGVHYSLVAQHFNYKKFVSNNDLKFEIVTPTSSNVFSDSGYLHSSIEANLDTRLTGVYKNDLSKAMFKRVNLRFADPAKVAKRNPKILMIGDSITQANLPFYIKWWLSKYDIDASMIGTVNQYNAMYDMGIVGGPSPSQRGEGRGGWRLTDFTGSTKRKDGSVFRYPTNPFLNQEGNFDFSMYMANLGETKVDFIVIQLGTNDLVGFHNQLAQENIGTPTLTEIIAYTPVELKKIIESVHAFDNTIKIGINPPPPSGGNTEFNEKQAQLMDVISKQFDEKIANVYFLANYLGNGYLSGKTHTTSNSGLTYVDEENGTMRGQVSRDVHDAGNNQMSTTAYTASWVINHL